MVHGVESCEAFEEALLGAQVSLLFEVSSRLEVSLPLMHLFVGISGVLKSDLEPGQRGYWMILVFQSTKGIQRHPRASKDIQGPHDIFSYKFEWIERLNWKTMREVN